MTWHDDRDYATELMTLTTLMTNFPASPYVARAQPHIDDINGLRLNHL
jgi:outer membrane protein assembly factor BamD (BamD/ComL family)